MTIRHGTTSVAMNLPRQVPDRRTYVTFGQQRGGTSAVAGVQRALGVYLGEIRGGNNEDHNFMHPPRGLDHLRSTIRERNATHDVWGFKFPTAAAFLPVIEDDLRQPFYVVVHRDPVATALSRARWDGPKLSRTVRMALAEASSISDQNMTFAMATDRPVLLVSSAAASSHPSEMIDELADFLAVDTPAGHLRKRLLDYLLPGSYKQFDDYFDGRGGVVGTTPAESLDPVEPESGGSERHEGTDDGSAIDAGDVPAAAGTRSGAGTAGGSA